MAIYSIRDLEKLSGIKAHTIRMWEQRYDILEPQRTETNIRYYQDEDLKLLLNIALLNKNGIRISKIAKMSEEQIVQEVASLSEVSSEYSSQLDALTISMIEMDEFKFDRIISANIQQIGFERTMLEVIYPFLDKLSVLWLTGSINPVQENFISYLIRQKIIVAIDNEPIVGKSRSNKFMIYLPEGEKQELSLLFMLYMLKSRKLPTVYLGQEISVNDLEDAYEVHRPDFIFTMITENFARESVQQYLDRLCESFPTARILVSGYQVAAQQIQSYENIQVLASLGHVIDFLDHLNQSREAVKRQTAVISNGQS
ncbi:MerR family transcriptional regulator [Flavilitoribacter nigricans]|uniref:Helix-turn-helix-type transcriptional regulator n=1 Tax=Flavilitoribacter nigricans (strain ATCC 23147 / DSM 23189 / NBRC 102662 / NCIMB 1420 / SS-2) TaxID=1122177 RepID=A0A2D0MY60_FLAN2|nr:MerR family transcriptional regulator [Flavilitoribacter nigricans]PHN01066.1 helix-turn-helix-type transcriptional regulator [Flavilitoribacter nigricans DSM 23189 = NBRC 102662]